VRSVFREAKAVSEVIITDNIVSEEESASPGSLLPSDVNLNTEDEGFSRHITMPFLRATANGSYHGMN
jgi:hypothetical protein